MNAPIASGSESSMASSTLSGPLKLPPVGFGTSARSPAVTVVRGDSAGEQRPPGVSGFSIMWRSNALTIAESAGLR
jgi:hypothetical protein